MMLKTVAGRAVMAGLLLLTILAVPLPAQQDRYEEESGVPDKARELFNKAQRLEQAGKPEEAIKTYQICHPPGAPLIPKPTSRWAWLTPA